MVMLGEPAQAPLRQDRVERLKGLVDEALH